jgi:Holliday junction resolvasome RuvABC endonuclease subunit
LIVAALSPASGIRLRGRLKKIHVDVKRADRYVQADAIAFEELFFNTFSKQAFL